MNKLVINTCYGGFSLSKRALNALALMKGVEANDVWEYELPRYDHDLIKVVESLGPEAWGDCAELEVVTIPGHRFRIREYDGYERVETPEATRWVEYPIA
tara:strand:+ start:1081 stop:1380 length:300 start_codon:yes stop_codon:yes gene_type:complete